MHGAILAYVSLILQSSSVATLINYCWGVLSRFGDIANPKKSLIHKGRSSRPAPVREVPYRAEQQAIQKRDRHDYQYQKETGATIHRA